MTLLLFLAGLVLLIAGAEVLVRGASRLARRFGISPLVIGLTVVAFGTSAPEMAVSVRSRARRQADIALGNVVGSNIFNVLFILGLSALIAPLVVAQQLVRLRRADHDRRRRCCSWILAFDGSRRAGSRRAPVRAGIVAYIVVPDRAEARAGSAARRGRDRACGDERSRAAPRGC